MKVKLFLFISSLFVFCYCQEPKANTSIDANKQDSIRQDSIRKERERQQEEELRKPITADEIQLKKDITFKKYNLEDEYLYNKKPRKFQWDKIKQELAYIETFQKSPKMYAVISNYKNKNGEAPLVASYNRNNYKRIADTLGTERYQSVPLYAIDNRNTPVIYGKDGSLVSIISEDGDFVRVNGLTNFQGEWDIPKKYITPLADSTKFMHVSVIDVTNQNIATLERKDGEWIVRSMNPATTGKYSPPYAMKTPTGIFLIQERKSKMFYYKDGTTIIHGYAPWASRFTNGAYIHGVPTSDPKAPIIEYSYSLGTTPRSHMCVRNASSHAKFIYDRMKPLSSLVVVID